MPSQRRSPAFLSFMIPSFTLLCTLLVMLAPPAFAQTPSATDSGQSLEKRIQGDLEAAGFEIIAASDWSEARLYQSENPRFVILNAPYNSIYGHRAKIEFRIILNDRQILVETKRQRVPGSVDEKLPYVFLNARHNLPELEFVLILDGEGFKPGAITWIKAQAAQTPGFNVLAPGELVEWLANS